MDKKNPGSIPKQWNDLSQWQELVDGVHIQKESEKESETLVVF